MSSAQAAGADGTASAGAIRAWDGPTRLYHWAQLLLVCGAYYTQWYMSPTLDPTMRWHRWCGYGILILLVFRLLWGFVGSPTARFGRFIRSPATVLGYLGAQLRGGGAKFLGHNPLGALMVLALLLALAAQGVSGLFTADSNAIFGGPFGHFDMLEDAPVWKARLQSWHHLGANLLLALVALHVLVNLFYQYVRRERLITAMISGDKPAGDYVDAADAPRGGVALRALVCLAIAAVVVLGGIRRAGGVL